LAFFKERFFKERFLKSTLSPGTLFLAYPNGLLKGLNPKRIFAAFFLSSKEPPTPKKKAAPLVIKT
jgi:hypothetical protein